MIDEPDVAVDVYAAVGIMPIELGRLIGSYLQPKLHTWPADESTTTTTATAADTILSIDDPNERRMFVSETPLLAGTCAWSVEFELLDWSSKPAVSVQIGVTTIAGNRPVATPPNFLLVATDPASWTLVPRYGGWSVVHDQQLTGHASWYPSYVRRIDSRDPIRCKVWITADRQTGRITARWFSRNLPPATEIVSANFYKPPVFDQLRPAIVIVGRGRAVIRSGPSSLVDCPTTAESIVLVSADIT